MLRGVHALLLLSLFLALRAQAQDAVPTAPQPSQAPASAPQPQTESQDSLPPSYGIAGTVRSGKTPLPGATITASNTLTGKKYSAVTDAEGKFTFSGIVRGRYVLRIEFMGFSLFAQEAVLNPPTPTGKIDAELILASRELQQASKSNNSSLAAARGFQRLALDSPLSSIAGGNPGFGG